MTAGKGGAPAREAARVGRPGRALGWACRMALGNSPISSRNRVPPSASSNRPGFEATAPVKAPRS